MNQYPDPREIEEALQEIFEAIKPEIEKLNQAIVTFGSEAHKSLLPIFRQLNEALEPIENLLKEGIEDDDLSAQDNT